MKMPIREIDDSDINYYLQLLDKHGHERAEADGSNSASYSAIS